MTPALVLAVALNIAAVILNVACCFYYRRLFNAANRTAEIVSRRLANLRRSCFLTDERGHRRRYAACSVEVRAMAEAD